jgi:hypothetical protein
MYKDDGQLLLKDFVKGDYFGDKLGFKVWKQEEKGGND